MGSPAALGCSTVWLGLAGEYVCEGEHVSHYETRVGGPAVLPGSRHAAGSLLGGACQVCQQPLSLLLQAGAPCWGMWLVKPAMQP